MYIDGVIIFSLVTIALILWMMGYIAVYSYRHIKRDTEAAMKHTKADSNGAKNKSANTHMLKEPLINLE